MSDTQDVKSLGLIAQQLRQLRGIETQSVFARRLGISRDALANYETGRTVPSPKKLDQFREALGLSELYFNESPLAQAAALLGVGRSADLAPSPDEAAILRLLRVAPAEVVHQIALSLLGSISSGEGHPDAREGEALRQAVERLAAIVQNAGKYDRSRPERAGSEALKAARDLARQAISERG